MSEETEEQPTEELVAEETPDEAAVIEPGKWRARLPAVLAAIATMAIGVGIGASWGGDDAAPKADSGHAEHADETTVWTCSMHPQIRSEEPGQCPICGMDLIPVTSDAASKEGASPARVQLNERAKTLAQIRTTTVERLDDATREVRLLGRVDHDETRLRTVTSWTAGRIDRLHVAATGTEVRAGQTIATIYSPEIYAAHRDLLAAKRQLSKLASAMEFARSSAEATVDAARQKLRLLGVSNSEIASMEEADSPWTAVKIRTRFGGTVIEKLVDEGAYIQPGTGIYKVADLTKLWVQLDAYESDLPRLRLGQQVSLTASALPEERFVGTISFIDPVVDRARRTARVRVEVDNSDEKLKPGMFVEAVVQGGRSTAEPSPLVIPASAPLFSGQRSLVYVEIPDAARPTYEAREVKLGPKAGSYYPVVSGLSGGERVVTHGAFAIDADLQLRGGASLMTRADDASRQEDVIDVPAAFREALEPVIDDYLRLQAALADDDFGAAQTEARALLESARKVDPEEHRASARAAEVWTALRTDVEQHANHMIQARDIRGAREGFDGVSKATARVLAHFGNPTDEPLHLAHCPMVFENRGAEWIQRGETVDNSYYGAQMLTCGEIRQTIPAGGHLPQSPTQAAAAPAAAAAGGHQH